MFLVKFSKFNYWNVARISLIIRTYIIILFMYYLLFITIDYLF